MATNKDFYALSVKNPQGKEMKMEDYKGKVLLIVNTATKCGLAPQFDGLEALHQKYKDQGLVVLGFPCNQFGRQEPGSADEIGDFCSKNYGVSFQMMEKVDVKGEDQHPVYSWLCNAGLNGAGDNKVAWNFHKFLVDGEGRLKASLKSGVDPLGSEISAFAAGK